MQFVKHEGDAMDQQVLSQLQRVIDRWCGLEATSYGRGKELQEMWEEAYPVSPDYDPDGILSLLEHLYHEPLFRQCPKALQLHRGYFVDEGGIRTFGKLYDYLEECGV
jgi:hypothetical protein